MTSTLTLTDLSAALKGGVAFRANLELQPAAGAGTKVYPSSYAAAEKGGDAPHHKGHSYATELRRIDGEDVVCVLLDSVASQANRMEQALLDGWDDGEVDFPVAVVNFTQADESLPSPVGRVTALDAPHRIYDAILRDSVDSSGALFRTTEAGRRITEATPRDASALYTYCPTALIFGAWDSTGPKGGLGSKFQRCLTSEIVGIGVLTGTKVGGRLDPLGIVKKAGPMFAVEGNENWAAEKPKGKAKELWPSNINHGNIAPTRDSAKGGVTFDRALQTTVLSLPALRRLKFRRNAANEALENRREAEHAAHSALAALALYGLVAAHAEGHDLRSGALLVGNGPLELELVDNQGRAASRYSLSVEEAASLVKAAAKKAASLGLVWHRDAVPSLTPAPKLAALLKKSQELSAIQSDEEQA